MCEEAGPRESTILMRTGVRILPGSEKSNYFLWVIASDWASNELLTTAV
jgi:hypothetical protein